MKNLFDFDLLVNEVFYRGEHILSYIDRHSNMSDIDKEAIKNTIMDALVTKGLINKETQSLDLENLCIVDNLEHHTYQEHPNISGIPLWMKEEFRKKTLYITGGIPISIFLSRPTDRIVNYCVYDPNTAVSSIFNDATFIEAIYDSPTRNIRLEEPRPFVEVEINQEKYLVDILTKRILKTSWFKEKFNLEIIQEQLISKLNKKIYNYYLEKTSSYNNLEGFLLLALDLLKFPNPKNEEMSYEIEQSKNYFPDSWKRYEEIKEQINNPNGLSQLLKSKKQNK